MFAKTSRVIGMRLPDHRHFGNYLARSAGCNLSAAVMKDSSRRLKCVCGEPGGNAAYNELHVACLRRGLVCAFHSSGPVPNLQRRCVMLMLHNGNSVPLELRWRPA